MILIKMLEKIIRSPINGMFMKLLLGIFVYFKVYAPNPLLSSDQIWFDLVILAIVSTHYLLIFIHNKRNPKRKLDYYDTTAMDMQEEDEGEQWITFQASRKVHLLYYYAIPLQLS